MEAAATPDSSGLAAALAAHGLPPGPLEPLAVNGVAHAHVRLCGTGLLVRIPRWSQADLDPARHLAQEAAGFRRAAAAGCTPRLAAVLPPHTTAFPNGAIPNGTLANGALVVAEIAGHPPRLPEDLAPIARALARVHALPVPLPADRPPLPSPADPVAAVWAMVERQAVHFAAAVTDPAARALIEAERDAVRRLLAAAAAWPRPEACLVLADTHPGNFLVDAAGAAWFVDLEKAMYGLPAIDLAHATLYTSTTWDPAVNAVLAPGAVTGFYAAWIDAVPPALAAANRPWFGLARRLTWLRTLSWMARWRAERTGSVGAALPEALRAHIQDRIADFFHPGTLGRVRGELAAFVPP